MERLQRFELVAHMLRKRLSPEQIAGKLRSMTLSLSSSFLRGKRNRSNSLQTLNGAGEMYVVIYWI